MFDGIFYLDMVLTYCNLLDLVLIGEDDLLVEVGEQQRKAIITSKLFIFLSEFVCGQCYTWVPLSRIQSKIYKVRLILEYQSYILSPNRL